MPNSITFRPRRRKRELKAAWGNVTAKLNELIERELSGQQPRDWREVLERAAPKVTDQAYAQCLKPE